MTESKPPLVCANALLHLRFVRRDPDRMAQFLEDFGFRALDEGSHGVRYFRTLGPSAWSVAVSAGEEDAFTGFGLGVDSEADLQKLADVAGAPIENSQEPGGGRIVKLRDPDGRLVEAVYGQASREPLPHRSGWDTQVRVNRPLRVDVEPSPLLRLGHVVLGTPDFAGVSAWYRQMFGMIPSDLQELDDGTEVLGFFRLDRGDEPADHHTLALLATPVPVLLHVSTETIDIDAIGQGSQYLHQKGWEHHWGIGRHILGSQFFDYWRDPAGDEWEHYSDGDLLTADYPTGRHPFTLASLWAWGQDLPASMRPQGAPPEAAPPQAHEIYRKMMQPPREWMAWGKEAGDR